MNYYESQTDATLVAIELATPDFKLFNENGTGYVPNGEGLADNQQAANNAKLNLGADYECAVLPRTDDINDLLSINISFPQ